MVVVVVVVVMMMVIMMMMMMMMMMMVVVVAVVCKGVHGRGSAYKEGSRDMARLCFFFSATTHLC